MAKKDKTKKQKKATELKKTFSNRRESVIWENSVNTSLDQWEKTKENQQQQIKKAEFEAENKKREETAKVEKQKVFLQETAKEKEAESSSLAKRKEIDEKIRAKKRLEVKKKDIATRNKSIYG